MPYFKTAEEWLDQSKLLLEARPATTKITTRYSIHAVKPRKPTTTDTESATDATSTTTASAAAAAASAAAKPPRGVLVFKTYDPASGVTLKYRTTKAAEVSRLIHSSLGSLGRGLAALPQQAPADETLPDAPTPLEGGGDGKVAAAGAGQTQGGGGGGKKKKKGKK